ncbi:MAG: ribonuclease III [Oscillospiraceae bacterium]|nr:ribonuclease III [Oscillospiraceae bacterium]
MAITINIDNLEKLQNILEYSFNDLVLLDTALTHSSYANENRKSGSSSNERLEFLGDSVLGMTVATIIYTADKDMPEGQMTRLRAELVCEKSLVSIATAIDLGSCLHLGKGEEKSGGRLRPSILADALEAVIGAIYLDGGFEPVYSFVSNFLGEKVSDLEFGQSDYKTRLQEIIQEKACQTLDYRVTGEKGPDHLKIYTVEVRLNHVSIGLGTGKSKKEAEQDAARVALESMAK